MNGVIYEIIVGAAIGGGAGSLFFGGLWWTINHALGAKRAGLWFVVSSLVRGAFAVVSFWFALQWGLVALASAMVSFLAVRVGVIRYTDDDFRDSDHLRETEQEHSARKE